MSRSSHWNNLNNETMTSFVRSTVAIRWLRRAREPSVHVRARRRWSAPLSSIAPDTRTTADIHAQHAQSSAGAAGEDATVDVVVAPDVFQARPAWVVFSDLHVRRSTLDTCLQVLRTVHETAVRFDAGVAFLGDFWHVRNSLPVEPLNAVLAEMQLWTQPVIMIPGNHDQVSFDGSVHALRAIQIALGEHRLRVFDKPTFFHDALWLPYRRDPYALRLAATAATKLNAKVIFCHVDVAGASANNGFRSVDGVDATTTFPPDMNVFSGHFHRPHTVRGTRVRYVGSPYQVSFNEKEQSKSLLVFQAPQWQVQHEVPIDVGPRHYSLVVGDNNSGTLDPFIHQVDGLRQGDRVLLETVEENPKLLSEAVKRVHELGVAVSVRQQQTSKPAMTPRIEAADKLSMVQVFLRYARLKGLSDKAIQRGQDLLLQEASTGAINENTHMKNTQVTLDRVRLNGFGSFVDEVTYSLQRRGLVLLLGKVHGIHDGGIDSNGAGKSTLAMAPLWCLSGFTDVRPEGTRANGLGAEMLNDTSNSGGVQVFGTINGDDFFVDRQLRRRGRRIEHTLQFMLGDKDLTQQTREDTQKVLDSYVDSSILTRVCFFGQHSAMRSLLESTDRAMKEELARIVPIQGWEALRKTAAERDREYSISLERLLAVGEELQGQAKELGDNLAVASTELAALREDAQHTLKQLDQSIASMQNKRKQQIDEVGRLSEQIAAAESARTETREGERDLLQESVKSFERDYYDAVQEVRDCRRETETIASLILTGQLWESNRDKERVVITNDLQQAHSKTMELNGAKATLAVLQEQLSSRQRNKGATSPKLAELLMERKYLYEEQSRCYKASVASQALVQSLQERVRTSSTVAARVANHASDSEHHSEIVCDVCLQPVRQELYENQREKLRRALDSERARQRQNSEELQGVRNLAQRVEAHISAIEQEAQELERRDAEELRRHESEAVAAQQRVDANESRVRAMEWQLEKISLAENPHTMTLIPYTDLNAEDCRALSFAMLSKLAQARLQALLERAMEAQRTCEAKLNQARDHLAEVVRTEKQSREGAAQIETLKRLVSEGRAEAQSAEQALQSMESSRSHTLEILSAEEAKVAGLQSRLAARRERVNQLEQRRQDDETARLCYSQLETAFGARGVQSYIIESALAELQTIAERILSAISGDTLRLELTPFKATSSPGTKDANSGIERIEKSAFVRRDDGQLARRSLRQLSGGQWRRVSMALSLAFAELVERRCGPRMNIIVLDEPFVHLDAEGRDKLAAEIVSLDKDTVIVVAQDVCEEIGPRAAAIDEVHRTGDCSALLVDAAR